MRELGLGEEGHRIIAEIAEHYLEPATAQQVRAALQMARLWGHGGG